jgi:hypothetical protein
MATSFGPKVEPPSYNNNNNNNNNNNLEPEMYDYTSYNWSH